MKAKFFQFILFILIFSSCSNVKVISHQWVDYTNSSTNESILASKANHFHTNYDFKISTLTNEINKQDSVVIVTKTGKNLGFVTKSDFDGYFIKIQNNREIYINNFEIKPLSFKQLNKKVDDTLVSKPQLPLNNYTKDINGNESLQNSLNQDTEQKLERSDDPWDRANSEFESYTPLETEIVQEKKILKKVQEPFSVLSFIFTLLGFLTGIGFLLGMIFGAISLSNIKNPENLKG